MELNSRQVEQWGIFEATLGGPSDNNPTRDVELSARFECGDHILEPGFYDGDGVYRVRLMPDRQENGALRRAAMSQVGRGHGTFTCVAPSAGNHGPVYVQDGRSFAYADGTPHWSVGTTCYAWIHQSEELQEQTLETLRSALQQDAHVRLPQAFPLQRDEPALHPYDADADGKRDFSREPGLLPPSGTACLTCSASVSRRTLSSSTRMTGGDTPP